MATTSITEVHRTNGSRPPGRPAGTSNRILVPHDVLWRACVKARVEFHRALARKEREPWSPGGCWAEFEALEEYLPDHFGAQLDQLDRMGAWHD